MIEYHRSAFGLGLLFRLNGSAVYRSMIPGLLSAICVILVRWGDSNDDSAFAESLQHPYAVGVLVASVTFLLVFRVQQGYARYWEAAGAVHHMLSKWLDATTHTAAFHMQCHHYDHIKPPSFFQYPHLDRLYLTRSREVATANRVGSEQERLHQRATSKSIEPIRKPYIASKSKHLPVPDIPPGVRLNNRGASLNGGEMSGNSSYADPKPLEGPARLDGNWGKLFADGKATYFDPQKPNQRDTFGFAGIQGGHTPPLFLQELVHLTSLLTAVALSTLRNDVEGANSPLDIYEPGSTWPPVDPDRYPSEGIKFTLQQRLLNFLGAGRSPVERTQYNAARPMPVLGGVSEGEIRFLQTARGPSAKTQLCWYWLSEYITREHLAGSLGDVGPPIVSRIIQFLGDGMIYYNHARKIMFIPFPFPHAQLSVMFILAAIPAVAVVMERYSEFIWLSCTLAFLTVTCVSGIHEVARELENPFRNVPNEIPLVTLQAQLNEALVTNFAGYHPDHFWQDQANDTLDDAAEELLSTDHSDSNSGSVNASNKANADMLLLLQRQKADMERQMKEMAEKQQRELERQKREIDFLRSQLSEMGETEEKKMDHGVLFSTTTSTTST